MGRKSRKQKPNHSTLFKGGAVKKLFWIIILFIFLLPAAKTWADDIKPDLGVWTGSDLTNIFIVQGEHDFMESIYEPFHLPRWKIDSIAQGRIYWMRGSQVVWAEERAFVEHPVLSGWCRDRAREVMREYNLSLLESIAAVTLTHRNPVIRNFFVERVQDVSGRNDFMANFDQAWEDYHKHVLSVYGLPSW
ncbi:hypothetical protein ACFL0L_04255 [Patescibacteria group bacterium]